MSMMEASRLLTAMFKFFFLICSTSAIGSVRFTVMVTSSSFIFWR